MWWNDSWPGAWVTAGPMMMLLLLVVCAVGMVFMMRGCARHGAQRGCAQPAPRGPPAGLAETHSAFEEYRADTLRRLDQEQHEFQQFIAHLRMAKDKAEFDQFMAERRSAG